MLPAYGVIRNQLETIIFNKCEQGHQVDGLLAELGSLPDSYDAMYAFAKKLSNLPMREDWPYYEPNSLEEIWKECDPTRPLGVVGNIDVEECSKRVETAFLSSVCGCILGKPLEVNPTLSEIREASEKSGEWPLKDYISEQMLENLGRRHGSWVETVKGRIEYVAPDDDVNYTVMGMLILEKFGKDFDTKNIRDLWLHHLPIHTTFGPERTMLLKAGVAGGEFTDFDEWVNVLNHHDELCGAVIRADAYGYACPGRPALAAELAYKDASWTHRRTGIYGTMYVAAVISLAQVMEDRIGIFETALKFVPMRSRFYKIIEDSIKQVKEASDWLDGYNRIHDRYSKYSHCMVYQEIGTLINTLVFAESIGDGICKQVSQGNDTDSFGATAGSILGAYFGPGHLDERWLKPFNDDIHTALAWFFERSLSKLAKRMGRLPHLMEDELNK